MSFCAKPIRIATLLLCLVVMFAGCSTLRTSGSKNAALPTDEAATPTANYYVEIHPAFGKPSLYTGEISKPTTVQEALEVSGAFDKLSNLSIDLHRRLPGGSPPLKLPVELKTSDQVKYEQDYALHPNDRIVARQNTESPLDRVVDSLMGR